MNVAQAFYNFLRLLGCEHRRRIVETALTQIEADEEAAAQRTIAAVLDIDQGKRRRERPPPKPPTLPPSA